AATVIARDLAAHLKGLDRPLRIHAERTARLLSAVRAVATPDVHRVTANAVADRPAETSTAAYSCLHGRRCYATLRWAVRECTLNQGAGAAGGCLQKTVFCTECTEVTDLAGMASCFSSHVF